MRRIKLLLLAAGIFLATGLTAAPIKVNIHGTIKKLNGAEVRLMDRSGKVLAIAQTKGDTYEIKSNMEVGDGRCYVLYVPSVGKWRDNMNYPIIYFMIDGPQVEVNGEIEQEIFKDSEVVRRSIKNAEVKGSLIFDQVQKYKGSFPGEKALRDEARNQDKLFSLYHLEPGGKTDKNSELLNKSSSIITEMSQQKSEFFISNIAKHSRDLAYASMINEHLRNSSVKEQQKIYAMFDPSIRNKGALAEMKERIDLINSTEVGGMAPDFELPDWDGKKMKLSSLRGKYVLVDFWASWCGPCVEEIPNIVSVYERYKHTGKLELIGVSTDKNEKMWRDKVTELGINPKYKQLIDGSNVTGKLYNYQFIPLLVLIGPDGKILERDLRGPRVGEMVDKHLK